MRRFVSGGNLVTDRHRFRPGPWSFDICGDLRKMYRKTRGSREGNLWMIHESCQRYTKSQ